MHDGEKSVLARATINVLAGRVVARRPPVAHSCCKTFRLLAAELVVTFCSEFLVGIYWNQPLMGLFIWPWISREQTKWEFLIWI